MSHGKTIRNETGLALNVKFEIRNGAEPFTEPPYGEVGARIEAGDDTYLAYGDDANPFLDVITATVSWTDDTGGSSSVYRHGAGDHRGAPGDTAMNTNDTVTVSFTNGTLDLAFSNGG